MKWWIWVGLGCGILVASVGTTTSAPCKKVYKNGIFLGCEISKHDPVLNTKWGGPVYNNYGSSQVSGYSVFSINKVGRYQGWSLVRSSGNDCLDDPHTWTGEMYKLGERQYAAWNDDTAGYAYYLITLSKDGSSAASALMVVEGFPDYVETNELFKLSKNYTTDALMEISKPFMCK